MANSDALARSSKRPLVGVGRIIDWPGGSVWIGRHLGQNHEHAHHAIQISLAMEGSFYIQAAGEPEWSAIKGVVVMPDWPHRFDGCGATVATLFVEPNSARGSALRQRFAGSHAIVLSESDVRGAVQHLHKQYLAAAPDEVMAQMAQGVVCRLAGNPLAAPKDDSRIAASLKWMRTRLAEPIRLEEVAASVHLSPSRFRHLFVAKTGTSLRAWLLWERMGQAVAAAYRGSSWTEAAHDAGFADAAHLTRMFRRMFGMAPTMIVPERLPNGDRASAEREP